MSRIKMVAYDLDNTLVTLSESHRIALNTALKEVSGYEIPLEEHSTVYNGLPTSVKLNILIEAGKIKKHHIDQVWKLKQRYTEEAIKNNLTIDWGKIKLHQCLWNRGIKICCVTNSIRKTAELALKQTGQYDYMDFIISNEDVKENKPSPKCYQLAMFKAYLPQSQCLAIEDSEPGIKAALAAGCHVMKVKDPSEVTFKTVLDRIFEINNGLIKDIKNG